MIRHAFYLAIVWFALIFVSFCVHSTAGWTIIALGAGAYLWMFARELWTAHRARTLGWKVPYHSYIAARLDDENLPFEGFTILRDEWTMTPLYNAAFNDTDNFRMFQRFRLKWKKGDL